MPGEPRGTEPEAGGLCVRGYRGIEPEAEARPGGRRKHVHVALAQVHTGQAPGPDLCLGLDASHQGSSWLADLVASEDAGSIVY